MNEELKAKLRNLRTNVDARKQKMSEKNMSKLGKLKEILESKKGKKQEMDLMFREWNKVRKRYPKFPEWHDLFWANREGEGQ